MAHGYNLTRRFLRLYGAAGAWGGGGRRLASRRLLQSDHRLQQLLRMLHGELGTEFQRGGWALSPEPRQRRHLLQVHLDRLRQVVQVGIDALSQVPVQVDG